MSNASLLVESLVSTVAKAFYNDTYVVFLEVLFYEKYIIEEEIGPRLKISPKEVRKICAQLEQEMIIRCEYVTIDEEKSRIKCYYIDHQTFVNVVRYRVYCMQKVIKVEERSELTEVYFQCPTCSTKYNSLEVQRFRSGDHKFICPSCCPIENFRNYPSEAFYRLVEIDNRGKLSRLELMGNKLKEQLSQNKHHTGIYDLLSKLKHMKLPSNLPSENIQKGFRTSMVNDDRVNEEIKLNFEYATGKFGSSLIKKKTQDTLISTNTGINTTAAALNKTEIKVNIQPTNGDDHIDDHQWQSSSSSAVNDVMMMSRHSHRTNIEGRDDSLPSFLRDSRVIGATDMLKAVENLQQIRQAQQLSQPSSNKKPLSSDDDDGYPSKQMKTEKMQMQQDALPSSTFDIDAGQDDADDLEDVDWEADDEDGVQFTE